MPFGDRTGPAGMGPRTRRAAGFCAGFGVPGFMNRVGGFGFFGRGRGGGGRGWRNWFYATGLTGWQRAQGWPWCGPGAFVPPYSPLSREDELAALRSQAEYFENALNNIKKRLDELQAKTDSQ